MNTQQSQSPNQPEPRPVERKHPWRVVVLDDVEGPRNCHNLVLSDWFKDVTILEFEDGNSAWNELSRNDPDLFVTDITHCGLSCKDLLARLAAKRAAYPIIVSSAVVDRPGVAEELMENGGIGLTITILPKPFTWEQYRRKLSLLFPQQ